mmetsp:Transcript_19784/g.42928  ORF Transcript_19784/g.42928 Transcript_19784/m.42928 type:complete len:1083 (-) Transcript_19784:257-3505(-)|eukprot:CAMPEP_0206449018 /NCGR_PEP_ID=MMETSP0324_2-20121206/17837_1 /ASSEMBLY_ACC=CAM_ASM_000836 /TAXON_ID=2866 /ORGANISM="Crypthecodinium cohnii, Strain Seligo" /LENGTH=1082 /DNA_ID=CAMNT_0053918311 /DNA_START=40 /DNA_END=3288 /DNA_ORIENTATION=+
MAAPQQSKAMVSTAAYIDKVANEVQGRLDVGKVPNPDQLVNYVKQVVAQLQTLIKGAPRNILEQMSGPWAGLYDFQGNKPLAPNPLTAAAFMDVLKELQVSFPVAPAPGPPAAATSGKGAAPAPAPSGKGSAPSGKGTPAPAAEGKATGKGAAAPARSGKGTAPAAAPAAPSSKGGKGSPAPAPAGKGTAPAVAPSVGKMSLGTPGSMRSDAAVFVPGEGLKDEAEFKSKRDQAPSLSEAMRNLPTYQKADWIVGGIRHNTVTVISGDTGCGKSTLIPQLVCDASNLVPDDKVVVCTQPRRVAAITLAEFVAKDRGQDLGDEVGYQIRFINQFGENTRLIYATTAIILRRLHSEPDLESVGCLIIDEVHERDVYTDFLLLLIKDAMLKGRMQHLKLVLMSATLNADAFAGYFSQVNGESALKPVHIPGRMYEVEDWYWEDACETVCWCPPDKGAGKGGKSKKGGGDRGGGGVSVDAIQAAYDAISMDNTPKGRPGRDRVNEYSERTLKACALWREREVYLDLVEELIMYFHKEMPKGDGAIMVFLPGWGDISKLFLKLHALAEPFKVITLHSLMTPEQQHEAFERPPPGLRKIVLSTNIAEASVTIDDIVYVIDTGVRKERSYDASTGVSSLDTKMVTKANAKQRRGRAGRCQEGLVVHLFPSYKVQTFEEFPTPQMLTSSMEEVVLQAKVINGGTNKDLVSIIRESMPKPDEKSILDGVNILKSLSLLTREGDLTVLGRAVAAIPVQPSVAKFLLLAGAFRVIKPAACIAAFLSIKSPFQQTPGTEQSSGKKVTGKDYFNKGYASDHFTMLQAYVEWRREAARGNDLDFCDEQGLSPETLDMAYMMVQQFVTFMADAGYDGPDVQDGSHGEVAAVKKGSEQDALVRAAMVAAFQPNLCILYRGQQKPYWWTDANCEVSPFRGSANAEYQMHGQDGDEWMVFSDAMQMGRFNSIMDSSLVFSPFVLLFAKAVLIDEKKGEIYFDKWFAAIDGSATWIKELKDLRNKVMPAFKECIEARDLSTFPPELCDRIAKWCCRSPIKLSKCEPVVKSIDEAAIGPARKQLSMFEWPKDEPAEDSEEEQ